MIVIGSGPAGISCALALLKNNHHVTMLDVGLTLEPSRQTQVEQLARRNYKEWLPSQSDFMLASSGASIKGIPMKKVFGSDFPYRGTEKDIPLSAGDTAILPSFARGGLSTVWGAAVLPFRAKELADWPLSLSDLEPHYQAIFETIPLCAESDRLEKEFPFYSKHIGTLPASRQARRLMSHMTTNKQALSAAHVTFGRARLAVYGDKCVSCGMCLSGCPYAAIYSASDTWRKLLNNPRFQYDSGWVVKRISESQNQVTVHATHIETHEARSFQGKRVFLAGGVISTTRLLLESKQAYEQTIKMRTSQHFMVPWLQQESTRDVDTEALHTLSQVFMEMEDPAISAHAVHLQFYSYNVLLKAALERIGIGHVLNWVKPLRDALYGRLLVTQGYLHSKDSGDILVRLKAPAKGEEAILEMHSQSTTHAHAKVQSVLKKLSSLNGYLKATPLGTLLTLSKPGGGYHAGGTFPMSKNPASWESDVLGRPHGFEHVHAVDASIFPTIPATTITLSVMANAHRIGSAIHD
jgi:choline dehydrogenase-like flavoprotein